MIVDGVEVLYTMRNGKIVDPNIPMDGLVCYLDTRGKYNTDVYRNTLLDLSGNGNHGALQNFSFADGSGYENGGLKFDGVDDGATISRDFFFNKKPFTYLLDFEIPRTAKEQNSNILLGWAFFINYENNNIYSRFNNPNAVVMGTAKVGVGRHIFVCNMGEDYAKTKFFLDGNSIGLWNIFKPDGTPVSFADSPGDIEVQPEGVKKINKMMIWDRQLTDEEITKLMEA